MKTLNRDILAFNFYSNRISFKCKVYIGINLDDDSGRPHRQLIKQLEAG